MLHDYLNDSTFEVGCSAPLIENIHASSETTEIRPETGSFAQLCLTVPYSSDSELF